MILYRLLTCYVYNMIWINPRVLLDMYCIHIRILLVDCRPLITSLLLAHTTLR